jgi:hypothetical protein
VTILQRSRKRARPEGRPSCIFCATKGPGRQSEASIDAVAKALSRFESYTRNKDFKTFRKDQAIGFTAQLSRDVNERTGEPLSKATLLAALNALKAFFTWLSQQRGFKSKFTYVDAEYFALSLKDTAIAKTARDDRFRPLSRFGTWRSTCRAGPTLKSAIAPWLLSRS